MYVYSDDYRAMKKRYDQMGIPTDNLVPVDSNYAFVPQSKDEPGQLKKMEENNQKRFGLEQK